MKMTTDDILIAIEEMDNLEKGKLLRRLNDKFFDNNKWETQKWAALEKCIQESATLIEKFPMFPEGATRYSTTEIAEIFGVSEHKINDWIEDGRFLRLTEGKPNQPVAISADSIWIAKNGNMHYVSEFVKEWEEEKSAAESIKNKYTALFEFVKYFENKYGGDFKSTLGAKAIRDMTAEEESDTSMWQYCLKTIEGYINQIALERKEDVANIPLRSEIDN
ncbi:helix-turn-helix domain-containing protein [Bacillus paranthracis]|uniref:helix-turn-helix domain-containing protein n=1 Tax=Bacillus paranthracis TaxID=2026186 RepID=UPI0020B82F73|nr:helix-turn-helix domain-containing protein [Bacillus paranthracis]